MNNKYPSSFSSPEAFEKAYQERLQATYMKTIVTSSIRERFNVLGTLIRERIALDWIKTEHAKKSQNIKEVHYFSMEFLLGRLITNNLQNLRLRTIVEPVFHKYGLDLNEVEAYEADPGLGNGGLGRLAACYLDSLASLKMPATGHTIRYRYGLFRQKIKNGYQEERPDNWLSDGYVWEIRKEEEAEDIPFFGKVEYNGKMDYLPDFYIRAVPYDVPIVGDENGMVNVLRLWNAEASRKYPKVMSPFDYERELEKISGILYPDDTTLDGKRLRLMQQYFFTSAGVKSVLKKIKNETGDFRQLSEQVIFHINDTHPTLIIPEIMRILLDEEGYEWVDAWEVTRKLTAYTNHTILAEALERWPVSIFQPILPRIYQLIEEIDRRFRLELLATSTFKSKEMIEKLAIIEHQEIRMAHCCVVASSSVNGVAKLHTEILKKIEMADFYQLFPEKFRNVTNGISHRRWLIQANPELTGLLKQTIGKEFLRQPEKLAKLLAFQDDERVQATFLEIKRQKKMALAERIFQEQGIRLDPTSLFDIQVKRLHEYKRQLMNALHLLAIYLKLKNNPEFRKTYHPHTFIFGAKAAANYYFAKKIIKLINTIAKKVNQDADTCQFLKVVFVENYNVSYAEVIMPAADLSEQISTASKEASGTGNMKFMMNGALTIGTEDGANVEIHELVGDENIFIFGLRAEAITKRNQKKDYVPKTIINQNPELKAVLDLLVNGFFTEVDQNEFREIYDKLVYEDPFYVLADFESYQEAHKRANQAYQNPSHWAKMALINIAKSGIFSSDRSVQEYCDLIWKVKPLAPRNEE